MRLNTEPYAIEYRKDTEMWHISGPGITTEPARDSRFSAEQLAHAMSIAYEAGKAREKFEREQIEFDEADW